MSRKRIIGRLFIITGTLLTGVLFTLTSLPVSAATEDEIMNKTLLNAARLCMKNTYTESVVSADDLQRGNGMILPLLKKEGKNNNIYVPTKVGNKIKDSSISCKEVFDGASGMPGVLSIYNKKVDAGSITSMGYKGNDGADLGKKCLRIEYIDNNKEKHNTNSICFASSGNSKIVLDTDHMPQIENIDEDAPIRLIFDSGNNTIYAYHKRSGMYVAEKQVNNNDDWNQILAANLGSMADTALSDISSNQIISVTDANFSDISQAGASWSSKFTKLDPQYAGNELVKYLTNGEIKTPSQLQFTEKDKFDLYSVYFNRALANGDLSVAAAEDCTENKPSDKIAVKDGDKWCEVKVIDGHVIDQVTMIDDNKSYPGLTKPKPFNTMLKALMDLNYDDPSMDGTSLDINSGGGSTDESDAESTSSICAKGAGSLGYIMCPALETSGNLLVSIYKTVVANFLTIDAEDMKLGGAIHDGWKIFQNYANIVFVILLLVIILSQVTGFGVNNYGIKKMLPKLIVVVVLVNVSFVICQLAVDLSNILGVGLQKFFGEYLAGLALGSEQKVFDLGDAVEQTLEATMGTAATATIAVATVGYAIANIENLIPMFLLTVITAVIGIIFFFLVLAVRKVGVLLLVVFAPVAIVLYTLPNTKRLFDRWKKLFISLLMIFPICGLLMGGSRFGASVLVQSSPDEFFTMFVAMLLNVVPFFMVPTLVRGSVNGIAGLGNKLAQTGNRFAAGANRRVANSEGFKDFQKRMDEANALRRAERLKQGKGLRNRTANWLNSHGYGGKVADFLSDSATRSEKLYGAKHYKYMNEAAEIEAGADDLVKRGSREFDALVAGVQSRRMKQYEAEQENLVGSDKRSSNIDWLKSELTDAQNAINANPDDMRAVARMGVLSKRLMVISGDAGATAAGESILEAVYAGDTGEGVQQAARKLMSEYGKILKDKNPRLFDILSGLADADVMDGGANQAAFLNRINLRRETLTDANGNTVMKNGRAVTYIASDSDTARISSMTEDTLAGINEDSLDRMISAFQRGEGTSEQLQSFIKLSENTVRLGNDGKVKLQAKIRNKLNLVPNLLNIAGGNLNRAIDSYNSAVASGDVAGQAQISAEIGRLAESLGGSAGGQSILRSVIQGRAANPSIGTAGLNNLGNIIRSSANYNRNYGGTNSTPGMRALLSDISSGNFSHLTAANQTEYRDSNNNKILGNTHYEQAGLIDTRNIATHADSGNGEFGFNQHTDFSDVADDNIAELARIVQEAKASGYSGAISASDVSHLADAAARTITSNPAMRSEAKAAKVEKLNEILKIAGRSTIDPNNVRMPEPIPAPPPGYSTSGTWIGGGTETKRDKAAFEAWAQEAENIRLRNSKL